jgi:peptidoglycan/LPS O-acetylase OafA/YrhL
VPTLGSIGELTSLLPRPWPGMRFPLIILTAVLMEKHVSAIPFRVISKLGDISYSMYLFHFPLQLISAFCVRAAVLEPMKEQAIFYSAWTFLVFMLCLFILSHASYHFLELPIQKRIREHLMVAESS